MNVLAAVLVFVAVVGAVPAHFPRGKSVIYKYYADVKAGTIEPVPYASQFALNALLHVKQDITDPSLENAYYVVLTDVKFGLYNGQIDYHEWIDKFHSIPEVAKDLQKPFVIVYDNAGKFQGVKILEDESGWSRNMKQAVASMLQLDLWNVQVETPMKPHSFITIENTIHGDCQVAYDIQPKLRPESSNVFVVTKMYEPKNCSHFIQGLFDHVEADSCYVEPEDSMSTASTKIFEVESQENEILIKKLTSYGVINYMPWQARSEAHYLLSNQTLVLQKVVATEEVTVPVVDFQSLAITRDISFMKPKERYAQHAGLDLTFGRHVVELDVLIPKLKKLLSEAADYLEENHLQTKEPDWKHGQTINRIHHIMNYLDSGSLEQIFNAIQDAKSPREVTIKNIFLGMVPTVGTTASCLFTRNVVRSKKLPKWTALMMLHSLPTYVKEPSERLLLLMEDLVKFGENIDVEVRVASILCFSRLVRKTFLHERVVHVNLLLDRYLHHFFDHVKNEPTYYMKMVYMMAIKNVEVGNIHKLLEPIIRGDMVISEKPHNIRMQAIWAIRKAVIKDVRYVYDLLWPVLANTALPLEIRIAAYDVLLHQMPHMDRLMQLYWFMVYEKNEHLYNYHLTSIQTLANSVDPCHRPVREMAKKILRFTKIRSVSIPLSSYNHMEYVDPVFEHGETLKISLIMDELTGLPHIGSVKHVQMIARKSIEHFGIHWHIDDLNDMWDTIKHEVLDDVIEVINNENVKNVLNKARKDMPPKKDIHVDICITKNGQVISVQHYNEHNWKTIIHDLKKWREIISHIHFNIQNIMYANLYEMLVPTDMGLPAVLATRMPLVTSSQLGNMNTNATMPLNLKIELDCRAWAHGEYVMSIYNPVVDTWHSIRRVTSEDIVMPVTMYFSYNHESKTIKITLPRLPLTKLSITGIKSHAKSYVTVTEDETDMLTKCCSTCLHHEVVTKGTAHKKYHEIVFNSKDTGLEYMMAIFDCESHVTPVTRMSELIRTLSSEHKVTWGDLVTHVILAMRQQWINDKILPGVGSCGVLTKMEPSTVYPTSTVDLKMRISIENLDITQETMHVQSSKKINIRSSMEAKDVSTNVSARSWDVNVNIDMSQGHFNNNIKIHITRITPGEKQLKICVDGQKNYPVLTTDPLRLFTTKYEVNTKGTLTMGMTDEDKCVRDQTVITATTRSEMTEEQKKMMVNSTVDGVCIKDIQNPLYATEKLHIPKTWGCVQETILYSTMRKYTTNIVHKNVPQNIVTGAVMVQDIIRTIFLPHIQYTLNHVEPGTIGIVAEFPVKTKHLDVSVVTPITGYKVIETSFGNEVWNALMDNTHFSLSILYDWMENTIKICTVYTQVLLTADNSTIPFVLPDQWTLLSGTHLDDTYAIFAKAVEGKKIAVKIFVGTHNIEIVPHQLDVIVTVDGVVNDAYRKGIIVPPEEPSSYAMKLTKTFQHLIVDSERVPVQVAYTSNSITVLLDTTLQGRITGLCGHLDNTHKETIPKIYTTDVL